MKALLIQALGVLGLALGVVSVFFLLVSLGFQ